MRVRYHQELSINSSDFQLESGLVSRSQVTTGMIASQALGGRAKLRVPGACGEEGPTNAGRHGAR